MDYQKHYDALMARAYYRDLGDVYTERHHVVPTTLGGLDVDENIVRLTAEEHFIAHKLLVKMHPGNHGLVFALQAMSMNHGGRRPNNKLFGWGRRLVAKSLSEARKGVPRDRAVMQKMWNANTGRPQTDLHRANMSAATRGKPKSAEHRAATSAALKGRPSPMTGRQHSEETKAKMRAAALARKHTPETIEKLTQFAASQTSAERNARAHKAWATKRAKAA
jgi:hypothetical protein